jgi:hypothetical protein
MERNAPKEGEKEIREKNQTCIAKTATIQIFKSGL